ncbi:MAG TPA: hypothetical protein VEU74_06085 [Gemmatimonadales bacterium]|nr:hypothetical protein [Gemmatimonadales bacterium]
MITDGLNPVNLLALFALVGGTCLGVLAIGAALIARRHELVRLFAFSLAAGWALYGGAFLIASLTSRDRVLESGEEKHLCEIDCHLAYSVVAARRTPTLGSGATRQTAAGVFEIVTVQVRFDSATISPHRGMAPLWPGRHWIDAVDGTGRRYAYSLRAERALGQDDAPPLTRPLVPGESYTADLVFDVPVDAPDLRLEIASLEPPTWLVIGHENSFFHGKTTFRLST